MTQLLTLSSRFVRRGFSLVWLPASIIVAGIAAVVAVPMFRGESESAIDQPLLHIAEREVFRHQITEPGEVESSSNVEIRCEVKAKNSSGTVIIEIVPEGTLVNPGDFLIKFDSSALEDELTQQQIVVNTSKALVIQSKNVYETALLAKQEYLDGTYLQEEQTIESEIFVAEEDLRRAKEYLQYSVRLAAKGYVTALQVEADRFAVEKAIKALETAKTKLKVLQEFTKPKMLRQFDADIESSKAKLEGDQNTHNLDLDKLAETQAQIEKCTVVAPAAGKVIYANETDRRGNSEFVVEAGAVIRERQTVIRLPDLGRMQVKAKIDESRIGYIQVGLPATIQLDSAPETELRGVVTRVDEYPLPGGWFSTSIKQYATYIEIKDTHPTMRPGMTAQATIQVAAIKDSVSIPVQAVFERGNSRFCIVYKDGDLDLRRVGKGPTNHEFVLLPETGLGPGEKTVAEGEQIVLNPSKYMDHVEFPVEEESAPSNEVLTSYQPGQPSGELDASKASGAQGRPTTGVPGPRGTAGERGEADGQQASGPGGRPDAGAMFDRFDSDKDGSLSTEEIPERMRDMLSAADANKDGKVQRGELAAGMAKARAAMGAGGAGGSGGPSGGSFGGGRP